MYRYMYGFKIALFVFGVLALVVGVMYGEFDETMFNANLL